MDIQYKKIISLFFAALSICVCVVCTSCSDTMVELPTLYPKIIYTYDYPDCKPEAVLSVYSEVTSDAVRLSSMKVEHAASGLSWNVKPVTVLSDAKGKQYAGSSNLKMPEGKAFPEGLYTIIYRDYAGNTKTSTFTLENTMLENMPANAEINGKYIVYNQTKDVLYISSDTVESKDSIEKLSSKYPDAETVREYISDIRKKAVYILPEEPIRTVYE